MRALKFALSVTVLCAIAMAVVFGGLALTFHLFSLVVVMTEGWQLVASLVWLLEMVFCGVLIAEIT